MADLFNCIYIAFNYTCIYYRYNYKIKNCYTEIHSDIIFSSKMIVTVKVGEKMVPANLANGHVMSLKQSR